MRFRMETCKHLLWSIILTLLVSSSSLMAQVPERPIPPRLVNDLARVLSHTQVNSLEEELVAFDDSTTTQICLVTVSSLKGLDVSTVAYEILSTWGVGDNETNNGVVILVEHDKGMTGGRVAISVGYGLEGVVTDVLSKRIIQYEMIPHFKQNNYYAGISAGVAALKEAALGLYQAQDDAEEKGDGLLVGVLTPLILMVILLFIFRIANNRRGPTNLGGSNRKGPSLLDLLLLANMLGGRGGSGGFGGFGGGSRGGFGGFGGGTGGGGGASGSW